MKICLFSQKRLVVYRIYSSNCKHLQPRIKWNDQLQKYHLLRQASVPRSVTRNVQREFRPVTFHENANAVA